MLPGITPVAVGPRVLPHKATCSTSVALAMVGRSAMNRPLLPG